MNHDTTQDVTVLESPHTISELDEKQATIVGYAQHNSFIKLLLLNLLTLGGYRFYWFYENWDAIRYSERRDILPFWRSVFSSLYVHALFTRIYQSAQQQGYQADVRYGLFATFIVVLRIASYVVVFTNVGLFLFFRLISELLFWRIQRLINFYNSKLTQSQLDLSTYISSPARFFEASPLRFIALSILTFGLYFKYWQYKNWQLIKQAEKSHIWPFWRAIFSSGFRHVLYKRISLFAKHQGYDKSIRYMIIAAIQQIISSGMVWFFELGLFLVFVLNQWRGVGIVELMVVITLIHFCIFAPFQQATNFYNKQIAPNYQPRKGFTKGEVILTIMGLLLYGFLFSNKFNSWTTSPKIREAVRNVLMDRLTGNDTSWIIFRPESKDFKVKFPTKPTQEAEQLPVDGTDLHIDYTSYNSVGKNGVYYSVTRMVYPSEIDLTKIELEEMIQSIVDSSDDGQLIESKKTQVQGHRAVDFFIQASEEHVKGRIVVVGQTKYLLMVTYDADEELSARNYKRFIRSFSVKVA